jgi:UDP-N-acetylglucosamine 4-epimerase
VAALTAFDQLALRLKAQPARWLVTGCAGFIGSHLVETLLKLDQKVVGLDNFATGYQRNLDEIRHAVSSAQWLRFSFVEGDIRRTGRLSPCVPGRRLRAPSGRIGLGPPFSGRPADDQCCEYRWFPQYAGRCSRCRGQTLCLRRVEFDLRRSSGLPKVEENIGRPLSPYAVTKLVNELYAEVFARCYGFSSIGLRYFNVFGPRQDPEGAYAAVIPHWTRAMLLGEDVLINGDGETSRDFCYVANAVQANLLAATTVNPEADNTVYNVALDDRTSLTQLFALLRDVLAETRPAVAALKPLHRDFRAGDVRHSQADISKARRLLGYEPTHRLDEGIRVAMPWYIDRFLSRDVCGA